MDQVQKIANIIGDSGESILNDDGVDQKVCTEIAEEIATAIFPKTTDPVCFNHSPTDEEVHIRRAIHVLQDAMDDEDLILKTAKCKDGTKVYLVVSILGGDHDDDELEDGTFMPRPQGTVEYQVSDGPPMKRSHCSSLYHLKDALAEFNRIVDAGGWKHFFGQADAEAT